MFWVKDPGIHVYHIITEKIRVPVLHKVHALKANGTVKAQKSGESTLYHEAC